MAKRIADDAKGAATDRRCPERHERSDGTRHLSREGRVGIVCDDALLVAAHLVADFGKRLVHEGCNDARRDIADARLDGRTDDRKIGDAGEKRAHLVHGTGALDHARLEVIALDIGAVEIEVLRRCFSRLRAGSHRVERCSACRHGIEWDRI